MSGRKKRRETRLSQGRMSSKPWAGLYAEHCPEIRAWFATRVASAQDADDLAEEVLARLARGASPHDLKAYIATVTANAVARYRRRRARENDFLKKLLQDSVRADETLGREPKGVSARLGDSDSTERIEKRLRLYEARRPYRSDPHAQLEEFMSETQRIFDDPQVRLESLLQKGMAATLCP